MWEEQLVTIVLIGQSNLIGRKKKKNWLFGISEDKPIVIKRFGFSSDTEEGFKGQRDRFYFTSDITVENIYSPKMKKKKSI